MPKGSEKSKDTNYESDVSIDKNRLDEEWLKQPHLMAHYTKLKAEAKKELQRASEFEKVVKSELILKARGKNGADLVGVEKVTDFAIEAYYKTQKEYQDAVNAKIGAEYRYNVLDGVVMAIIDRKHGLQDLSYLWCSDYWSDSKTIKKEASGSKKQKENLRSKGQNNE